jgi:hypothetical protein
MCGHDPDAAARLRIEERELEAGGAEPAGVLHVEATPVASREKARDHVPSLPTGLARPKPEERLFAAVGLGSHGSQTRGDGS